MKNNKHFIATSDENTAEILRKLGFYELEKQGNQWMFVNQPERLTFASDDMKLNYTDMLAFNE